jgi:exodeoxyribonuclease-3
MPSWSIATWNVNSIRTRLEHVLAWTEENTPDVLCLQETKATDDQFPLEPLAERGWHVAHAGQKSYNGVALLSRRPLEDVQAGFPGDPDPSKARVLSGTLGDTRIITVYVPNGSEVDSPSYEYKLAWLEALQRWFAGESDPGRPLVILGDFNIAPDHRDVYDPERFEGRILCSDAERAALAGLLDWGLEDLFRRYQEAGGHYSWWDYRAGRFRRNLGLRIDLILATAPLAGRATDCRIDRGPRGLERPSDHTPVVATFSG